MTSWRAEHRDVERIDRIGVEELHERHQRKKDLQILDVREKPEWDEAHIPDAVHAPYHDIHGIPDGIDPGRPVAVMCSSGQRSAVAASVMQRYGAAGVIHVSDGGVPEWRDLGYPLARSG
jgi:rhodanese-related sulfurtransferase